MYTKVKTDKEIENIRISGQMLASVLKTIQKQAAPGMTGIDADKIAIKELKALGAEPAFLNYQGFPNSICISVNDEIVHGIPNRNKFEDGDLVSFDFGVTYNDMITDSAMTLLLGAQDDEKLKLIRTTEESLMAGINAIKGATPIGDISAAVQEVLERGNYGIVRDLVGHGVGHQVHEEPNIPNYGKKGTGDMLEVGMTIAIEPMATMGEYKVTVDDDRWTIRTADRSLSAHFEHTILITENGAEILTAR